jgi:hypothetical protein
MQISQRKPANVSIDEAEQMNAINAQWILLAGADAVALIAILAWFFLLHQSQFDTTN